MAVATAAAAVAASMVAAGAAAAAAAAAAVDVVAAMAAVGARVVDFIHPKCPLLTFCYQPGIKPCDNPGRRGSNVFPDRGQHWYEGCAGV